MPRRIMYIGETTSYIHGLDRVDAHDTAKQLAKRVPEATVQMLNAGSEAIRKIEEARRALSYYASVLDDLSRDYPDAVTRLTPHQQRGVEAIAHFLGPTRANLSLVPDLLDEDDPNEE